MFSLKSGQLVKVSNGAKKPSPYHRGKLRNWREQNFRGTVVRNTGSAIQVKNEDLSGSSRIVLRWFDYDSAVSIRPAVFDAQPLEFQLANSSGGVA